METKQNSIEEKVQKVKDRLNKNNPNMQNGNNKGKGAPSTGGLNPVHKKLFKHVRSK